MSKISRCGGLAAATVFVAVAFFAPGATAFTSWSVAATPSPGNYGSLLNGIAARSATDVWAVGATATSTSNQPLVEHFNGTSWSSVPAPNPVAGCLDGNIQWTGNTLKGVSATSSTDAWAVGHTCYTAQTLVDHWNGTAWRIVPSPSFTTGGDGVQNTLNATVALSAGNAWAAGMHTASNGALLTLVEHWNGTSWTVVASPSPSSTANVLNGIAATGTSDIWAVGYQNGSASQPLIEHWNGSAWSVVPSPARPAGSVLNAVTAISATDAWAVGTQPQPTTHATLTLVEHWNGTSWSVVPSPNLSTTYGSSNVLRGVAAVTSNDVWAVGMDQNQNTNYHQHRTLTLHWNGVSWSVVASPTPGATGELSAVAATPTGRLWGAGLDSQYNVNIYDGTYTAPRTLVLTG
jgi:hypothetical protein